MCKHRYSCRVWLAGSESLGDVNSGVSCDVIVSFLSRSATFLLLSTPTMDEQCNGLNVSQTEVPLDPGLQAENGRSAAGGEIKTTVVCAADRPTAHPTVASWESSPNPLDASHAVSQLKVLMCRRRFL